MNFNDKLNELMEIIGCNGKSLSNASGIASPIISGYRKGNRIPKYNSSQLDDLINGLTLLAKNNNISNLNEDIIRKELEVILNKDDIDFEIFRKNFNILINSLKINVSDLSKYIGFDSSFISKIRSGVRKPLNISQFANSICKFVVNNYFGINDITIRNLIKCDDEVFKDSVLLHDKLYTWLTNNIFVVLEEYNIDNFVKKLDDFDLNSYIKAIKFDKLFVPSLPKFKTKSKIYYGFEGYKDAQIEVLKQAALFKSKEDIFWFSNMPMNEASKDLSFTKKYMMYIAFILKKGIKLNIVHDLDRPFKELMLGLEGWIPLYMTGQINPYYFKNNSNYLYSIIECTSGNAILHGECITGNIDKSKILVSTKKEDIEYYKINSNLLLKKATPLMNIYTGDKKEEFFKVVNNSLCINRKRRNILLNLPCYTISLELLDKILNRNKVSVEDKNKIHKWINDEKKNISKILDNTSIIDEISIISENDFNNSKCMLDLSRFYYDKEISYNYQEYQEHINLLNKFKKENKNYSYKTNDKNIFKNINIYIIEDKQVIISKINNPITNFVIYHPILINAIQKFRAPIKEKDYISK